MLLRPSLQDETFTPLFCPHCEFAMRHSADFISFHEVGGCNQCDLKFLRTKRKLTDQQFSEYLDTRRSRFRSAIEFK
jgi:hypothetical protein